MSNKIRLAEQEDLDRIMEVEGASFGSVDEAAAANRAQMTDRIRLLNHVGSGWYWVALSQERLVAYLIAQPTHIQPDQCTSWEASTDDGTLQSTFSEDGSGVFGVSLGADGSKLHRRTIAALLLALLEKMTATRKEPLFFCSRMPGFIREHEATGVTAETYWSLERPDGSPKDRQLRYYYDLFCAKPSRLLVNGYAADSASGGHGVLVVVEDLMRAIRNLQRMAS